MMTRLACCALAACAMVPLSLVADTKPSTAPASAPNSGLDGYSKASFFGLAARGAGKVVFVIDHTGSMIDTFDYVREELKARIGELDVEQKFGVVMFAEQVTVFPKDETPVAATSESVKAFKAFIDKVRAAGRSDDLLEPYSMALKKAFEMKPRVIYFLFDGNFDPKLVDEIKRQNPRGKVAIHTIAFVKVSKETEDALRKIAKENDGEFRYVLEKDLGK